MNKEDISINIADTKWYKHMRKQMTCGKIITIYRSFIHKYNQKYFSEISNISIKRLSKIENDKVLPTDKELTTISKLLDVSVIRFKEALQLNPPYSVKLSNGKATIKKEKINNNNDVMVILDHFLNLYIIIDKYKTNCTIDMATSYFNETNKNYKLVKYTDYNHNDSYGNLIEAIYVYDKTCHNKLVAIKIVKSKFINFKDNLAIFPKKYRYIAKIISDNTIISYINIPYFIHNKQLS
jgi:transcriptional regulator with XRE-family HTH domain